MIISNRTPDGAALTVDSASNAMRTTGYLPAGTFPGQKWTYAYSDTVKRSMSTTSLNYGLLIGGEGKKTRLQRLVMTGTHTTSANYLELGIRKYKDFGAGTYTTLGAKTVAYDANAPGPMSVVIYTTAGITLAGAISSDSWSAQPVTSRNSFLPITGTPAKGVAVWDFDFRYRDESEAPVITGQKQCLGWYFQTAPSQVVTSTFYLVFTEENA